MALSTGMVGSTPLVVLATLACGIDDEPNAHDLRRFFSFAGFVSSVGFLA
eukprot:CAMPEP_0170148366 /NCGR_PEP_ID=MMETSP0033_2-20121228/38505_1 /TAXON_ID=195969 /ORGANISM="Dolichomastix tenuilepis, Strain CCMP3274" /LENGTH=49 /DNA_ID= /DNA_START= /DNA_END= /DNA_ORIENTATION=